MSTEPREFWLSTTGDESHSDYKQRHNLSYDVFNHSVAGGVHVIEHSAYQALEQKLAVAQKELEKCGEVITCVKCSEKAECPYAYDGYNTNGDCLAEK